MEKGLITSLRRLNRVETVSTTPYGLPEEVCDIDSVERAVFACCCDNA